MYPQPEVDYYLAGGINFMDKLSAYLVYILSVIANLWPGVSGSTPPKLVFFKRCSINERSVKPFREHPCVSLEKIMIVFPAFLHLKLHILKILSLQ